MDVGCGQAKPEEAERLPADESDLEAGAPGLGNGDGSNEMESVRQIPATCGDPEKSQGVEVVDWDGPNDPENPYACCTARSTE
jgi:hypothetical protein